MYERLFAACSVFAIALCGVPAFAAPLLPETNQMAKAHDEGRYDEVDRLAASVLANAAAGQADRVFALVSLTSAQGARNQNEACVRTAGEALAAMTPLESFALVRPIALEDRAVCRIDLGQFEAALVDLDAGLALTALPKDANLRRSLWHNKAWALEKLGRTAESETAYTEALALAPQDKRILEARSRVRGAAKQWAGSLADADALLALDPAHPYALKQRGFVLRELGRYEEAVAALDMALAKTGDAGWIENERGRSLTQLGRTEDAEAAYTRALTADPQLYFAWTNRADIKLKRGDLAGALADADQALALDPKGVVALERKAEALDKLSRWQDLLPVAEAWIAEEPDRSSAWFRKGRALNGLGRLPEAIAAYEKTVEIAPSDAASWNNLGAIFERRGDVEKSRVALQRAVDLAPTSGIYRVNLAIALKAAKEYDLALAALAEARDLPNRPANFAQVEKELIDAKVKAEEDAKQAQRQALYDETDALIKAGDFKGAEAKAKTLERNPLLSSADVLAMKMLRGEAIFQQGKRTCEAYALLAETVALNTSRADQSVAISGWECAILRRKANDISGQINASSLAVDAAIRVLNRTPVTNGDWRKLYDVVNGHFSPLSKGGWKQPATFAAGVAAARTLSTPEALEGLRRALYTELGTVADTVKATGKPDAVNAMVQTLKGLVADLPADDRAYMKKVWPVILEQFRMTRGSEAALKVIKWNDLKRL